MKRLVLSAAVVLIALIALLIFDYPSSSIEFNQTDLSKWQIQGNFKKNVEQDGLEIQCQGTCALISEELSFSWENYRYIIVNSHRSNPEDFLNLLWLVKNPNSPNGTNTYSFFHSGRTPQGLYIFDTSANYQWIGKLPWAGNVGQIAFQFSGLWKISRLSFASGLKPYERLWQNFWEYFNLEPSSAYTINLIYGPKLFGYSLSVIMGLTILFVLGLPYFKKTISYSSSLRNAGIVFIIMIIPYQLWFLMNNFNRYANKSAFVWDKTAERIQRYDEEFATLARSFEDQVPKGAKVFFPREYHLQPPVESNWVAFHFFGTYQPTPFEKAKYLFAYYPQEIIFDEKNKLISLRSNSSVSRSFQLLTRTGPHSGVVELQP